jgi:hypothetical protein
MWGLNTFPYRSATPFYNNTGEVLAHPMPDPQQSLEVSSHPKSIEKRFDLHEVQEPDAHNIAKDLQVHFHNSYNEQGLALAILLTGK